MFFFIGGIQPKTVDLDGKPKLCPSCGLYRAHLRRIDHYLSIFFLPLFRIKKGDPFLLCESCGASSHERGKDIFRPPGRRSPLSCPNCGKPLGSDYLYCPYCGKHLL